jgi:hypothetical protein
MLIFLLKGHLISSPPWKQLTSKRLSGQWLLATTDIRDRNCYDSAHDDDDDDGDFMQTTLASGSRWTRNARRKAWILYSSSLPELLLDRLASLASDIKEILHLEQR